MSPRTALPFVYADGGRAASFKGEASDCFVRAVAIATGRDYKTVYDDVAQLEHNHGRARSAREGVSTKTMHAYLDNEFAWTPTMRIGSGCTLRLAAGEWPTTGAFVVRVSKHVCAVIDGVVYDTHDPTRNGTRCVYGHWTVKA